jgi:hypothetical protein
MTNVAQPELRVARAGDTWPRLSTVLSPVRPAFVLNVTTTHGRRSKRHLLAARIAPHQALFDAYDVSSTDSPTATVVRSGIKTCSVNGKRQPVPTPRPQRASVRPAPCGSAREAAWALETRIHEKQSLNR